MNDITHAQLHSEHVGKLSDKWEIYLTEYDRAFSDYRDSPVRLLEIGIQNGGSLEIWSKYFLKGVKFVGCDINPKCSQLQFDDSRISVVIGDANADETQEAILNHTAEFDIVIDDGSHVSSDIVKSFVKYFPKIVDGGVFIAEDLHCSYWQDFGGGLYDPFSSITFFKLLADVINFEHWGVDKKRKDLFNGFCERLGLELNEDDLKEVHSVEFVNSICVVRKSSEKSNILGNRCVVGDNESIVPGLKNSQLEKPLQNHNFWSSRELSPPEELLIRLQELNARNIEVDQLKKHVLEIERLNTEYEHKLANLTFIHNGMSQSISWRVTKPLRVVRNVIRQIVTITGNTKELIKKKGGLVKVFKRAVSIVLSEGPFVFFRRLENIILERHDDYQEWVTKYDTFDKKTLEQLKFNAENLDFTPLISIVMPVYNTPVEYLEQAIKSVQNQAYKNWELCIADDASTNVDVIKLLKRYEEQDERIKVVYCEQNGHISKASNKALELVTGDYVALLDHDDLLREHTLYMVVKELNDHPDCKFIYTDEDKITESNVRIDPHFKPDWSPDLLLSMNYLCHFSVFKTEIIKKIGGFREGYEGSQDYDLQLRFTERLASNEIRHLPYVLYHWRIMPGSTASGPGEKDYCAEAGLRAVNDYFRRNKIRASAKLIPGWGTIVSVKYDLPEVQPLVSIIIPTRNGLSYLKQCVDSIFEKTTYSNYEIIIVDNDSDEHDSIEYLEGLQRKDKVNVLSYSGKFNYSAINNFAVSKATGEIICLLNNDTKVISSEWLSELVSHVLRPEVGVVGAKLLYDDDTIQHGGVIVGVGGAAAHAHRLRHTSLHGYFGRAGVTLNYSAVTGACMAVRKDLYLKLGGLDEDAFAIAYNDIDFCLRVREQGYWNVWTPMALLYHYESKTRGYEDTPEKIMRLEKEQEKFRSKWGRYIENDPAYNPNLSREKDFDLAFPPKSSLQELF